MTYKLTRNQFITMIHVAKRDLRLDDDTYRDLLTATVTINSLKVMTLPQLDAVLQRMKSAGFTVRAKAQNVKPADDAQSKLIRHLWLCLHTASIVRDPRESALCKYVERYTKVSALAFLNTKQASLVIEQLKQWCHRTNVLYKQTEG